MHAIEVHELRKSYDGVEAVRGISFTIGSGEVFGLLGRTAPGRRRRSRSSRATGGRTAARRPCSRRPAPRGPQLARADRRRPPVRRALRTSRSMEHLEPFAGYYAKPSRPLTSSPRRSRAQAGREDAHPLGRAEAAARPRDRARRRPRAAVPRRADDGVRSRRPASGLGDDQVAALARQDDPADDALHRGSAAARRPGRGDAQGEIVAAGTPAELTAAAPASRISFRRNGSEVVIETEEPTRVLHELTDEALRRARARGARGASTHARRRLPLAHGGRGMSLLLHQFRAEQRLFWRSRARVLHLPAADRLLPDPRLGLRRRGDRGRRRLPLPPLRDDRLRRRGTRSRAWPCCS